MNRRSVFNRRFTAVSAAVAVGIGMIWFSARAKAQEQSGPGFLAFGVVGIARGETERLNVVTVGVQQEILMELSFLDSQGRTLARSVERVAPGRAVFLDLHFAEHSNGSNHLAVRALVRFTAQASPGGYILPSVEVIDDVTGRTSVMDPDPAG